ncbi:unnamed protein product [Rotaria sp. Silwood1]|nr:unnamed protein product [Rotaria sp. Silwood1]
MLLSELELTNINELKQKQQTFISLATSSSKAKCTIRILSNGDNLSSLSSISLNNEEKVPTNVNATVPIAATITLEFKVENNPNSEISIISQGTRIIENSILLKTNLIENNSNVLFVLVYTLLYLIILIEDVEPTVS